MVWALPHLEGRRGQLARRVLGLLTLLCFAQLLGSSWFNARDMFGNVPAVMSFGFKTYGNADGNAVTGEIASGEARRSGLVKGMSFVAINGLPMPPRLTEYDVAAQLARAGDRLTLDMRQRDGRITRHHLTRNPDVWTMPEQRSNAPLWFYSGFTFLAIQLPVLVVIAVAVILQRRRPRDPEAALIVIGLLLLCFKANTSYWLNALFRISDNWFNGAELIALMIGLVALTGYPHGRFESGLSRLALVGCVLVTLIGVSVDVLHWMPVNTVVAPILVGSVSLVSLASLLRRYRRYADQAERQQIKWVVFGFSISVTAILGLAVGSALGILAPFQGTAAYVVGFLLIVVSQTAGPIGLLISLTRYRLYDAETAISRSTVYALLTASLVAVFGASEKLIESVGEHTFGGELGVAAGGIGAALAALMISPLHHRMNHWAERRFQRNLVRLRDRLPPLMDDLRETASLTQLAQVAADRIASGVRAKSALLEVNGQQVAAIGEISAPSALVLPLVAEGAETVGTLHLGTRPDGSLYGREERAVLGTVTGPIARAIAIVQHRERSERERREEMSILQRRVGALETALRTA